LQHHDEWSILIAMSRRLQVLLDEAEYRELQRAARLQRVTVSEWVRQALRTLLRNTPSRAPDRKLRVVREALEHCYPAPPLDQMLREIEAGYLDQPPE
jgi:hypothetical protein